MTLERMSRRAFATTIGAFTSTALTRSSRVLTTENDATGCLVAIAPNGKLGVISLESATTTVDLPPVVDLYTVPLTRYAIATTTTACFVIDARSATASKIEPSVGTHLGEAFLRLLPVQPHLSSNSERFAVFADGISARWLIDLERATATDLWSTFDPGRPFFHVAFLTTDGSEFVLDSDEFIGLVDAETLTMNARIESNHHLLSRDISPDGHQVAYVEDFDLGAPPKRTLWTSLVREPGPEQVYVDRTGTLRSGWIDNASILLDTMAPNRDTCMSRLDLVTETVDIVGVIPNLRRGPFITADGARALVAAELGGSLTWLLADLDQVTLADLPALDYSRVSSDAYGNSEFAGPTLSERSIVFAPDKRIGFVASDDDRFSVLDAITGEVRILLALRAGQSAGTPAVSRDGTSTAIGVEEPGGSSVWLYDLIGDATSQIKGVFQAAYSPDSRFILTNRARSAPSPAVYSRDGSQVRVLDGFDRAWWLG